jgi:4-amino-4-deoxy-L-arabinose transferase-like glycosyltransferase
MSASLLKRLSALDGRRRWAVVGLILLLAAFAIRCAQFGNPLIHVDENFYLLVGDRMLHGALPYVDIWDRKPVGLFLIFAAIRLLGGDGIVQYQVVATLFAAGTALVVARMAAPMAGLKAATVAGVIYLLLLGLVGGSGGQAPVFYNLFVAGAALATLTALSPGGVPAERIRRLGVVAMGLIGLAMQVKYTAVFEGVFMGLALMLASWRTSRRPGRLAADAAIWIAVALVPTGAAYYWYAWIGHADAFVYANFLSIGDRSAAPPAELARRLGKAWKLLNIPLLAVVLATLLEPWRRFPAGPSTMKFALAWLAAAILGYLAFGTYFNHYALPLFAPLAVACASLFIHRPYRLGLVAAVLMLLSGAIANGVVVRKMWLKRGHQAEMTAMVEAIRPRLKGCLYVWNGDPLLYHLTGSCLPTRYPFAGHLNLLRENGAIGVDQAAEVRRILAGRPSVIVDHDPAARDFNFEVVAIVQAELRRAYRPVKVVPLRKTRLIVYERIPGR